MAELLASASRHPAMPAAILAPTPARDHSSRITMLRKPRDGPLSGRRRPPDRVLFLPWPTRQRSPSRAIPRRWRCGRRHTMRHSGVGEDPAAVCACIDRRMAVEGPGSGGTVILTQASHTRFRTCFARLRSRPHSY